MIVRIVALVLFGVTALVVVPVVALVVLVLTYQPTYVLVPDALVGFAESAAPYAFPAALHASPSDNSGSLQGGSAFPGR